MNRERRRRSRPIHRVSAPPDKAQDGDMGGPGTEHHGSEALLTVVEAAQYLRISRNLAYLLVANGQIPCIRLGRIIRIPRAQLEAWLRRQTSMRDAS